MRLRTGGRDLSLKWEKTDPKEGMVKERVVLGQGKVLQDLAYCVGSVAAATPSRATLTLFSHSMGSLALFLGKHNLTSLFTFCPCLVGTLEGLFVTTV